jgi:signal peptidase I
VAAFAPEPAPPSTAWRSPASSGWARDDDVILRAFEEHAAAADDHEETAPHGRATAGGPIDEMEADRFEPLLGPHAAALVEEASQSPIEGGGPEWNRPARTAGAMPSAAMPWDGDQEQPVEPEPEYLPVGWNETPEAENSFIASAPPPAATVPFDHDFGGDDLEPVAPVRAVARRGNHSVVRELVETGLLAILVFLAVKASFQNFKVDGLSMYPTLDNGQFLIVNKLVYAEVDVNKLSEFLPFLDSKGDGDKRYVFHGPERGDIVVLQDPRKPDMDLIKRVIALPGETIQIEDGNVFINGYLLEEPYLSDELKASWHYTMPAVTLPEGEYFVMGDNRPNSLDSRSSEVGLIPKELMIGKAMVTYWPASRFGLAPNASPKITGTPLSAMKTGGGLPAASIP